MKTAQERNIETKKAGQNLLESELRHISRKMDEAQEQGRFKISLEFPLSPSAREVLNEAGYIIQEPKVLQDEYKMLIISWE